MSVWPGDVSPAALRPVNRHGVGVGRSADLSSLRCLDAKNSPTIGMCLAYSTDVSLPRGTGGGGPGSGVGCQGAPLPTTSDAPHPGLPTSQLWAGIDYAVNWHNAAMRRSF